MFCSILNKEYLVSVVQLVIIEQLAINPDKSLLACLTFHKILKYKSTTITLLYVFHMQC